MKLALQSVLFAIAVRTAASQYWIDYFSNYNNLCTGTVVTCGNIPSLECCELNDWYLFFPVIQIGSYGAPGIVVFTVTDDFGSTCGACQFTDSFGCYNNENPFNTAFVLGIPTPSGCSNAKVRRLADMEEISETGGNTTTIAASDPVCQGSRKPDTATVNGHDYNITDDNREEIMRDLLNLDATSFATKWQAVHRGPNTRLSSTPAAARAKGSIS